MLNPEKMKEAVRNNNYMIEILDSDKEAYLIKTAHNQVKITTNRAIAWVEAGIKDLDCRSKEEMLKILRSWL
jgi:hypothetical protein